MAEVEKLYVTWNEVDSMVDDLVGQMFADNWKPDYIVGITRGGLTPAIIMSHKTGIKMFTLDVRLRDGGPGTSLESNTWMAEEAFGYINKEDRTQEDGEWICSDPSERKKILILDDINDTGETIHWIQKDWESGCLPDDPHWKDIWNQNVKFAMLYENEASKIASDYNCKTVNKFEKDVWIVYPWERQYD